MFSNTYRVPQKKPSLSEISCGKYYSGWREIHVEFVFRAEGPIDPERLNSNSRVAFDHQIVIIIIKIVNIECSSMKMEYSSMNVESISYHLHLCHFH